MSRKYIHLGMMALKVSSINPHTTADACHDIRTMIPPKSIKELRNVSIHLHSSSNP